MAPTAPAPTKRLSAREKVRARLAASSGPALPKTFRPSAVIADTGFLNTKRDKRLVKSSAFASRIVKTSSTSTTKKKRSRGPSKSLVASLDSLGDALDSLTADLAASGNAPMDREQAAQGRVRHRSLKSRPGALKRKERVVRAEMERFGRSLAHMTAAGEELEKKQQQQATTQSGEAMETETQNQGAAPSATASRWAALRGQISQTMEQNPAFLTKT